MRRRRLLPGFIFMVSTALTMSWLGWTNEHRALIIPAACSALGIFLMRQYVASAIPKELVEAARLDGCGEFGIWWRVVLPLWPGRTISLSVGNATAPVTSVVRK